MCNLTEPQTSLLLPLGSAPVKVGPMLLTHILFFPLSKGPLPEQVHVLIRSLMDNMIPRFNERFLQGETEGYKIILCFSLSHLSDKITYHLLVTKIPMEQEIQIPNSTKANYECSESFLSYFYFLLAFILRTKPPLPKAR